MADSQTLVLANPRPLTADDAAGLEAATQARSSWQPTVLCENTFRSTAVTVAGSSLAASGDVWCIKVTLPSKMPGIVWYPIAFRAMMRCTDIAAFDSFWKTAAGFTVQAFDADGTGPAEFPWDSVTLSAARLNYDGDNLRRMQNCNPAFHAFPTRPHQLVSATIADNVLGAFTFTVDTWDASTAANTKCFIDARFLGFPQAVETSAGFYSDRLTFVPP